MTDQPVEKTLLPALVQQNPAPFTQDSQDRKDAVRSQVDRIMGVFLQLLPSNYVSQVMGPHYTLQFQAAAERIADFQITAQEVFADSDFDYTRSEVLYQIIGSLVFPDAATDGYPNIDGDITYRTFLKRMVALLLQGATKLTVEQGIALLTDATVTVIEKGVEARKLKGTSAWGVDDQFTFEVDVTGSRTVTSGGLLVTLEDFPSDPINLMENVRLVLRALKPAHTLYDFRYLFTETFSPLFSEEVSFDFESYYYEDFRKYCLGIREITGTTGVTLTDRSLFSDPTRDFSSVLPGATLTILTGINSNGAGTVEAGWVGQYRVTEVRTFPSGDDRMARVYTTVGGLSGTATVTGDVVADPLQDWSLAPEGDILTFASGPNAGQYRIRQVLEPVTQARISPSILRIRGRMLQSATGQGYKVDVDRLGIQGPRTVTGEDATCYFIR